MKSVKKQAAQGDVIFRRVSKLPKDAVEQKKKGAIVVAHSETGHHHVAQSEAALLFFTSSNPLVSYLKAKGDVDVVHKRPHDTHETLRLLYEQPAEGEVIWEIGRQREQAWSPEGWQSQMVAD